MKKRCKRHMVEAMANKEKLTVTVKHLFARVIELKGEVMKRIKPSRTLTSI